MDKKKYDVETTDNIVETDDRRFNGIDRRILNSELFADEMFFVGKIRRWQCFGNEDFIKPDWFMFYVLPLYTILRQSNVLLKKNILGDEEIFCLLITGRAGRQVANKWSLCNDRTNCAVAFTCAEFVEQKYRLNGHNFLCVLMITGSTIFITDDIQEVDESNELHEAMIDNVIVPDWARSLFERTVQNICVVEIKSSWHEPCNLPVDASWIKRAETSRSNRADTPIVDRQDATLLESKIYVATVNRESSLTKRRAIVDEKNITPVDVQAPPTKTISVASVTNDPRVFARIERALPFQVVNDIKEKNNKTAITSEGTFLQSQIRSRGVYDEEFDRFLRNVPLSFFTSDIPDTSVDSTNCN